MTAAFEAAALKLVREYIDACIVQAKQEVDRQMSRGDRLTARTPVGDVKIASVSKVDPKPVAKIVDETAFREWIRANYPESVKSGYEVSGSTREVVDVLFEHAPHLIRPTTTVDQDVVRAIKQESAAIGAPVGPGGEADVPGLQVTAPPSSISVRTEPGAMGVVMDLFQQGHLRLESFTPAELPGGEA